MATVITLAYENTLKEAATDDGTVEGSVIITVTGADFAGDVGASLTGATVTAPDGLTAVLKKTSANTATLTFTGQADANDADIANLAVTFADTNFTNLGGNTLEGAALTISGLGIDFLPLAGDEPEPEAPAPFSGPLFIASVEELATGAGGDPTIGAAGKVKLTGYAATPDSTITIFNGSKKVEGGTFNLNKVTGVWTFETPSLDKAGVYNFTAKETFIDNSGTKEKTLYGGPSNTLTYTVDTKAPPTPKVDKFKLPTANTTPTITGKAEKFAEVEVFAKLGDAAAVSLGKVQANDKGIWSLQVENELAQGTYALTAKATDAAGNTSAEATKTETLTIDTKIGGQTIGGETGFTITADKGLKYSDGDAKVWATKALATQKFEGTAEANSVIQFFGGPDGTVPLGKPVKVNKTGAWKATLKLTDGEHVISAVITDQAGNQKTFAATADGDIGAAVGLGTIKVDSFAPIATVKNEKTTPTTLSGLVEHDAVEVNVYAGKDLLGTVKTGLEDGTWELAVEPGKVKGKQKITVTATDAAGNVSKASAGVTYDFKEAEGGGGGAGTGTIAATVDADEKTLTEKTETFVTQFGSVAVDAVSSTVAFDASNSLAKTAETFSIKLAGVNGDNLITVAGFSPLASASALAEALQTALREADSDATDISVAWDASVLTITDAKGRAFSDASLKDGDQAELDDTITITNGSVGVVAADSFSNLAALDVLTGFAIGTDKVDLKTAAGAAADTPTALTRVTDVATSDDLSDALSTAFAGLDADVAGLVVINGGSAAGTYLYADNGNGNVDATADVFIKLVDYTGTLGNVGTGLTVGDFFA